MSFLRSISLPWFVVIFTFILAPFFVNPNPFGNNPEAVHDESVFMTNAFNALAERTLPGFDFENGAFYGAPLTLAFWMMLSTVALALFLIFGSPLAVQGWMAVNSGELLHLLRILNGLLAAFSFAFIISFAIREQSLKIKKSLFVFLALLATNSLFLTLAHTGKGWILSILIELAAGVLLIVAEHRRDEGFALSPRFISRFLLLAWLVTTLQTVTSFVGFGFWIAAFLFLRHVVWRDLWREFIKLLPIFAVLILLNLSFFWNGWRVMILKNSASITNVTTSRFLTSAGDTDWVKQLVFPFVILIESAPLAVAVFFAGFVSFIRSRLSLRRLAVAVAFPIFTYFFYHVAMGFGMFPRYVLPLSFATAFSAAWFIGFLDLKSFWTKAISSVALIAATVVAAIFWRGASEREITKYITDNLNRPEATIVDLTRTLNLPMNAASAALLSKDRPQPKRLTFFVEHSELDYLSPKFDGRALKIGLHDGALIKGEIKGVWTITQECRQCSSAEKSAASCVEFNQRACAIRDAWLQEGTTWTDIFRAPSAGRPYILARMTADEAVLLWQTVLGQGRPPERALVP